MAARSHHVRNILAYSTPELFWGFAWTLTLEGPMPAAFASGFDGPESFVGTLALIAALGLGLPMLLSGFFVEPMRGKRAFVFWGHVAGGLVMAAIALLIPLAGGSGDGAVRLAYLGGLACFFLTVGLLIPAWLALVGELFPEGMRARALGFTFIGNRIGSLLGGLAAREVLATTMSPTDQWTLLFALAGAAATLGSLPFLLVIEQPRPRPSRKPFRAYARGLVLAFRELPMLRRFIGADLLGVGAIVVAYFYADAAIRQEGFHASWAGVWSVATSAAMLVACVLVTWLGDRIPPRIWLTVGACCAAAGGVLAAVGGHYLVYGAAAAASGTYLGLRMTNHSPQVMRLSPGRDSTAPIGIAGALATPIQGAAPFVAGFLIPLLGYLPIFSTATLLALGSGLLLLLWVRDPTGNKVAGSARGATGA